MADGQRLSDDQMVALERKIADKFDNIKSTVHRLQGTIDSLEGNWKGIGANAFNTKQHEINTSMKNIGNILVKFLDAMTGTRKIKDDSEDQVRQQVNKINVYDGAPKSTLSGY
ncbi:WXG100 family type VII secretion target [Streptomyces sp. NBC_01474]|uniref:WXG100 family type VII secretion target n=1 Tax=unclassified Streptomyces TaxID=2593676 RepID=UPI002DDA7C5E|nr:MULTISPECIES: WXG100 family type VII secretion target [unclassified Streptomyces]WSD95754.1 WXG100 family type VII secretion target [Streptomyces sp. NBC_01474]